MLSFLPRLLPLRAAFVTLAAATLVLGSCGGGDGDAGGGSAALEEGRGLARAGRHAEAVEAYRTAVEAGSTDAELQLALAQSLFALERFGEAQAVLTSAASQHANDEDIALNLGLVHLKMANLDAAASELRRASTLDPTAALPQFYLGRALYDRSILFLGTTSAVDQDKLAAAIAAFERAIELDPDDAEARYRAALAYDRRHEPQPAIKHLEAAARQNPSHVPARRLLGQLLVENGEAARGRKELEAVLALDATSPETLYQLGVAHEEGGDDAGALARYEQAVELKHCHHEAYFRMSAVLRRLGRDADAEAAHAAFERWEQAEKDLGSKRIAAMAAPNDGLKQHELGLALLELMRFDEARTCFRRALELNPSVAGAHYALGRILQREGDLAGARAQYELLRSKAPDTPTGLMELAQVCFLLDDPVAARAATEMLVQVAPDDADARVRLADLLLRENQRDAARTELNAALASDPEHVAATFNLGVLAFMQRDWAEAERYLTRTLELDAEHPKAQTVLDRVHLEAAGGAAPSDGNG